MTTVGVLALQGDFREHRAALSRLGAAAREVRLPRDLAGLDGLIIPGGESTTIARLLDAYDFTPALRRLVPEGFAIWGTCAGAILLATEVHGQFDRTPLGCLPMTVDRNAYGRQIDSFETDLDVSHLDPGGPPFHAIFIRAPRIRAVGPGVEVLLTHPIGEGEAEPVAVRHGRLFATTFHPELTHDSRLHEFFLRVCVNARGADTLDAAAAAGGTGAGQ